MVCADRAVILLNKRLDSVNRRDVFIPTLITGVSVYHCRQSTKDGGIHAETETFKLRIPVGAKVQDGRSYIPEALYNGLLDAEAEKHWTLRNEDYFIVVDLPRLETVNAYVPQTAISEQQAMDLANSVGYQKNLGRVISYADNTDRGSEKARHWRIGGA